MEGTDNGGWTVSTFKGAQEKVNEEKGRMCNFP